MMTKEYRTIDKSAWPRGPWDEEPDKVQWQDEATGLPCLVVRNPAHGNLCGYVGVPDSHPWHAKGYNAPIGECNEDCGEDWHCGHSICSLINVHGGLTFSDVCQPCDTEAHGICHVPDPGEPDHVWWFGFDCAHAWDLMPGYTPLFRATQDESYRDIAYVRNQVAQLAAQIAIQGRSAEDLPGIYK